MFKVNWVRGQRLYCSFNNYSNLACHPERSEGSFYQRIGSLKDPSPCQAGFGMTRKIINCRLQWSHSVLKLFTGLASAALMA